MLLSQYSSEDHSLLQNNSVLETFVNAIKNGYYSNMRTLKNDIEEALNIEVLKARGILE